MLTELEIRKATVTEGYRILLQAESRLTLPVAYPQICKFYRTVAEKCLTWACEMQGERIRRSFVELPSIHERSRFSVRLYRLEVAPVWESATHAVILCRSIFEDPDLPPPQRLHRMAQTWCLSEETALPMAQVRAFFGCRSLPFRPEGVYPEGEELVFFRNANAVSPGREVRFPMPDALKATDDM